MLKRTLTVAVVALLAVVTIFHRGVAQEKVSLDKVVAVVGNSIILYSELDEVGKQLTDFRRQQGYTTDRDPLIEALEELMQQKLLYNQAQVDSIEINKSAIVEMAEEQVAEMIKDAGSVSELETIFHRPIYEIKREISFRLEERQYAQQMRGTLDSKVSITPGEVDRFFRNIDRDSLPIIPIQYVYAQITKFPLSTEEAKLRAREEMLSLRERIVSGTRFDVLARMYSEDGSAVRGGELDLAPAEQYEPSFAKALEKLKVGQVSEVVETIYGFHIIELLDKKDNLYHLRHILIRPKFTDEELSATRETLDSLAQQIRADSISFADAAFQHSDDKYSKLNGGIVSNLELMEMMFSMDASEATTRHFKEDLAVGDFRALDELKPGEISDAFESSDTKGNNLSKIVKLIEIIPSHPASLKDDYLRLEAMALAHKKEEVYRQWLEKKVSSMFIRISPEFRVEEEFENKFWLK